MRRRAPRAHRCRAILAQAAHVLRAARHGGGDGRERLARLLDGLAGVVDDAPAPVGFLRCRERRDLHRLLLASRKPGIRRPSGPRETITSRCHTVSQRQTNDAGPATNKAKHLIYMTEAPLAYSLPENGARRLS